jgi:L-asparaginase / beta-aspartyl-peptidase
MIRTHYWLLPMILVLGGATLPGSEKIITAAEPAADAGQRFAVAIHGGAGGIAGGDDSERRQRREAALERVLREGVSQLQQGADAVDVVERLVAMLEDTPQFNAGRGSVLNEAGQVEMDASLMDGRSGQGGAVAAVTRVKNPIHLARQVMQRTSHVLLVGEGAERLAESWGLELADDDYFRTEQNLRRWEAWRREQENRQRPAEADQSRAGGEASLRYLGTVGCVALDRQGNLAAATSTGGTRYKLAGRVGDSPILGAGNYADNASAAVSCTGIGELFIRHAVAYDVAARIRYRGDSLAAATEAIIHEVLPPDSGGLIAVDAHGEIALPFNTPGMARGAADWTGRFEVALGPAEPSE